jgi:hypothetical protein
MSREHGVFVVLIVRKFRIEVRFGMEERETVREKKGAAEIDVVEEMAQGDLFVCGCCVGRMEEGVGCLLLFHRHREEKDVIRRERQVRSRWKRAGYAKGHGSVGCDGKCTSDDGSISRRRVKRGRGGVC